MIIPMTTLSNTLIEVNEREVLVSLAINRGWKVMVDNRFISVPTLRLTKKHGSKAVTMSLEFTGDSESDLNYVEASYRLTGDPIKIADISDPDEGKRCFVTAVAIITGQI